MHHSSTPAGGLRLAIFTDTALPQLNGVSRTLDRLSRAVVERGGAVRLFTTTDPDAGAEDAAVRYPSRPFWAYPQLRLALPGSAAAAAEMRSWGATLVHAATPFGVGLAGRRAARALGLPFVTSYHTSLSAYARYYRLGALAEPGWAFLRWFHNSGARTYCPTRSIESELLDRGFQNTAVWSRGVDTARFAPAWRSADMRRRLGAGDDSLVVAYVGRLAAEKGLDVALEAMRRVELARPGRWRFAFAGDGPYAAHCRASAPAGSVFLGQLVGDELSAFYASADIFVFPSTTDTFGNVLLEAMASGLPVVGADVGPTREVLGAGGGATFAAGDPSALAAALMELERNPALLRETAAAGLANSRGRSWDRIFDSLVADYHGVVAGQATPAGTRGGSRPGARRARSGR